MRELFLIDKSASSRMAREDEVLEAFLSLQERGVMASCLPQILEDCYSSRDHQEYRSILVNNTRYKQFLAPTPTTADIALDIQETMSRHGRTRKAGVVDIEIAATAISHSGEGDVVTVVHYDDDYEAMGRLYPELSHEWIVPRGSVS